MKTSTLVTLSTVVALFSTAANAQTDPDPSEVYTGKFGLGGYTCKQEDDSGKMTIYFEGLPNQTVWNWLQLHNQGKSATVPMPQELVTEIDQIPGCALKSDGTLMHHAAKPRRAASIYGGDITPK